MDLEKIERALEKIQASADKYVASAEGTTSERLRCTLFASACEALAVDHLDDLLRLVRAIRWMAANAAMLTQFHPKDQWCVGIRGQCEMFNGDDPIAAIEAAMNSNQQRAI